MNLVWSVSDAVYYWLGLQVVSRACYHYHILSFMLRWHPIDWLLFNIINLSPSIIHNLLSTITASHLEILNYLHSGLTKVFYCNNVTKIPLIGHHKSSKYSNCRLWSFFKIVQIKYCLSWELQSYTHFGAKNAGIEIWRDFCVFYVFFFLCWWHSVLWWYCGGLRLQLVILASWEGGRTTKRGDKAGLNIGWQFVFWAVWICSILQPLNTIQQKPSGLISFSGNVK